MKILYENLQRRKNTDDKVWVEWKLKRNACFDMCSVDHSFLAPEQVAKINYASVQSRRICTRHRTKGSHQKSK